MPGRKTHLRFGTTSGAVAAAFTAREQPAWGLVAETVGGGVGGALGAVAPDVLEPAIHSWHRSLAHSYATAAAGAIAVRRGIASWQQKCRSEAARHQHLAQASADSWSRIWHSLAALFWRMAAGFAVGAAAGYASHLLLDAGTPRGLPLLV